MMIEYHDRERPSRRPHGNAPDLRMSMRIVLAALLLSALHGCGAGTDTGIDVRTLATIDAALDEDDLPADVLAQQHRLFEALAENRREELAQYLDLTFRFNDIENPSPTTTLLGSGYQPAWRQPSGLNYYQFLARETPAHPWAGRTLEIVWSFPGIALVVAHHDERDPVFTEWQHREDGWKAVRLTINSSDETLQQARASRRANR